MENKQTRTYYSEDYLPMRMREVKKASKDLIRDVKAYIKNDKGWGSRKRIQAYKKQRSQKYFDLAWDVQIDQFTAVYIVRSKTDKSGLVHLKIYITIDDETGKIKEYDIGDTERGWNFIKDNAYSSYLQTHKDNVESKEFILRDILKEIEKRSALILNLLREKPRSRNIPAKVRYEVFMRDDGKCVLCGSNINIEFDHIIPFSKGGSNNADNIRVLCQSCNRSRGNRMEKF